MYDLYDFKHQLYSFLTCIKLTKCVSFSRCLHKPYYRIQFFSLFRQQTQLLGNRKVLECSSGSSCVTWRHQDLYCVSVGPPTVALCVDHPSWACWCRVCPALHYLLQLEAERGMGSGCRGAAYGWGSMVVGRLGFSGRNGRKQFLSNVLAFYYLITRRKDFLQLDLKNRIFVRELTDSSRGEKDISNSEKVVLKRKWFRSCFWISETEHIMCF